MTKDAGNRVWWVASEIGRMTHRLELLMLAIGRAADVPTGEVLRPLAARCREEAARISRELLGAATALGGPQDAIELKDLPPAEDGQLIECSRCGDKHMLMAVQQRGEPPFLFYTCRGRTYLGGVNGRLVAGSVGDGS